MPSAMQLAPKAPLSDGTAIPVIGLGTYKGNDIGSASDMNVPGSNPHHPQKIGDVEQAVLHAIDTGYRHIDCALLYESEGEVGRAVQAKVSQGVIKREDMYICTKLWNNAHRPDLVEPTCRQSLSNLGMDYVDLYLMHWPTAFKEGPAFVPRGPDGKVLYSDVDILDTYRAMEKLVEKKLVRSLGVSNFNSEQLRRLLDNCTIKPVVNQVECHPYLNQKKLIALCRQHGIQVVAYSPFGSPDSPWSGGKVERLLDDPTIAQLAKKHNKTSGQVILRYLVQNNAIPIPKSVTKSRIEENFDIFDFELTDGDMKIMDGLNKNRRICPFYEGRDHPEYPFNIEF